MTGCYVYCGEGKYPFELPPGWTVLLSAASEKTEAALTVSALVGEALAAPISAPRLADLVGAGSRVALLVDDGARPTPVRHILPPLLEELRAGGARREHVDIVVALGTHRPLPPAALADRLGEGVIRRYRVRQHDCRADDLLPVGRLSTGGEVRIDPVVARADVRIGVGSILPHPFNGFGGGAKIVMPGVSCLESAKEHHLHFIPQPDCYLGNLETNPAYGESCRVAEQVGLDFIVNCVYNAREEVVGVVAGHFRAAHRAGVEASRENYAVRVGEPADVTITSAYPYVEGPQIIKPLIPACLATKRGGAVIMVASGRDEMPEAMLDAFDTIYSTHPEHTGRFAADSFRAGRLLVAGSIEFNWVQLLLSPCRFCG